MIEKQADICIVGAAGSGLAAAVKAIENGAKNVIVLEKMKSPGGCTRMCAGLFAVDSPVQKRMGYHYTADECFRDLITALNWTVDAMLVRKWLNGCGESIRWLENLGMEFDSVEPFNGIRGMVRNTYHMSRAKNWHTGNAIIDTLLAAAKKHDIEILSKTRATKLLTDNDGKVCGVIASRGDEEIRISAKSVVLATGSISNNKELIARFYQGEDYGDIRIMARVPHNTGDGLIMAEELGAGTGMISTLFIGPHNHFPGASEIAGSAIRRPHLLRVNRNGERIVDESFNVTSEFGWMIGANLDRQPGKVCYGLMDSALLRHMRENERECLTVSEELVSRDGTYPGEWLDKLEEETFKEQDAGRAKISDTLDEIAEWMGAAPVTLKETVKRYNSYCANGYDADFLKDPRFMFPISTPPFYAYKGPSGIDTCIGGLLIDRDQRVLTREHYPINGLYAAGVLTSGWCAHNYAFFGSELSYTIYSGRAAGENAAKYISK